MEKDITNKTKNAVMSTAKNTAIIAVMAAVLISGKLVLAAVPNVEIVTPLIVVFTCVFRFKRAIFSVLVFCLLDNLLYSFSYLTTVQYLFHWPLLCLCSELTYKLFGAKTLPYAALALIFALFFWVETPLIYALFKFQPFLPSLAAGFVFMLPMAASGTLCLLIGFLPLYKTLYRIKEKMFPETA